MKNLLLLCLAMAAFGTVQAQKNRPPLVYTVENTGSSFKPPRMPGWDGLPEIRELPDPLKGAKKFRQWARRRSDIGHMIQHFGIGDRMGWSIVSGHGHCQLPPSQYPEVQAFIDRFLLGRDADTRDVGVTAGIPASP